MPPKRKAAAPKVAEAVPVDQELNKPKKSRKSPKEKEDPVEDIKDEGASEPAKKSKRTAKTKSKTVEETQDEVAEEAPKKSRKRKAKTNAVQETEDEVAEKPEKKSKRALKTKTDSAEEFQDEDAPDPPKKAKRGAKAEAHGKDKANSAKPDENDIDATDFNCDKANAKGQSANFKITCWNVGGLRAWVKKEGASILANADPDILCLQETKCDEKKLPDELKNLPNYKTYWCASEKDGYAGVAILSKKEPIKIDYGIGDSEQDKDGRCVTAEYENFILVCVYVPNAGRKLVTLPKRLEWNEAFKTYIADLNKKKPVIICGDMNVAHQEIDLANPKTNTKNAGFTKEERDGMTDFLEEGYVDVFRHFYPDQKDSYTFWTYMANARARNVGWRLDYFIVPENFIDNVCDITHHTKVLGSDHCPLTLFLNI